ncbi:hypothetical protein ACO0QE_000762 [Hanseniaspora vineae]
MSIPQKQSVVVVRETGGPEVLRYESDWNTPIELKATEVLIKNKYVGVNFLDNYFRSGLFPAQLPKILGQEASGHIAAKGAGIPDSLFKIGDPVGYMSGNTMAQYTRVDTASNHNIIKLQLPPEDAKSDKELQQVAAGLASGLTVLTFTEEAFPIKENQFVVVWAAAGGAGLLFDQVCSKFGKAHVIAIASTNKKLEIAKNNGAEYGFLEKDKDLVEKIKKITGSNQGADVVFDGVGKATFKTSLDLLKPHGTLVSFGNASGPPPKHNEANATILHKNLKIINPIVFNYLNTPEKFKYYGKKLISLIESGELKTNIFNIYELSNVQQAIKDLESRMTYGKLLLRVPS